MLRNFSNSLFGKILSKDVTIILKQSLNPSLRVVTLMIVATGIAYPLLLVLVGNLALPFQSTGSMVTLDGKVVGSKLIGQEFKSDNLFHIRPATNSTSTVDPHITPEDAYAQVPRISKATGLPEYTLKTILQFNIEKNKVTNVLVFAPNYVNVLEVNVELISGYPDVYQEFVNKKLGGLN
ncbi:MAG: potassium-transporting ATPase subunit C [Nitrososphaeraceae archaeon]